MKKAIVCMGIGKPYEKQLRITSALRNDYALRHGWDIIEVTTPDPRVQQLERYSPALRCYLQKLLVPDTLRGRYDLVLFLEADIIIHPEAPCISKYAQYLPKGGFGAVSSHLEQERKPIFGFLKGHYSGVLQEARGNWPEPPKIPHPDLFINGGVELYRPDEVADRWLELFAGNNGLSDESLLSLFEVQADRVFFLPSEWNRVWVYQKRRLGVTLKGPGFFVKAYNHLYNHKFFRLFPFHECRAFKKQFPCAYFHHLMQEPWKLQMFTKAVTRSSNGHLLALQ